MAKPKRTDPVAPPGPRSLGPIWTYYRLTLHFVSRLCGSTPADPAIVGKWLAARAPLVKPAGGKPIEQINEEVLASLERGEGEPSEEFSLLTFQRHDGAFVLRAATIRAHYKDCARVLSQLYISRQQGESAFSTRVVNGVYHDENAYWIPIRRPNGNLVTAPDGTYDKAIHARGPRGMPINALKQIEYIAPPVSVTVLLKVLGKSVPEQDLHHLFTYGGTHGYGGERSDGEGRYTYELTRIESPDDVDSAAGRAEVADGVSDH